MFVYEENLQEISDMFTCCAGYVARHSGKSTDRAEKGQTFYAYRVDQLKKDAEGFSAPSVIGWVSFNTSDTTKVTLLKKCTGAYDMEKVGAASISTAKSTPMAISMMLLIMMKLTSLQNTLCMMPRPLRP